MQVGGDDRRKCFSQTRRDLSDFLLKFKCHEKSETVIFAKTKQHIISVLNCVGLFIFVINKSHNYDANITLATLASVHFPNGV